MVIQDGSPECRYLYACVLTIGGDSTTVLFADGESIKTLQIMINGDDIPERDETVRVSLVSASGGAVIAPGEESFIDIVIKANDNAAGVFGFELESRQVLIMEGETVSLTVERSVSQEGEVEVYWNITGLGDVTQDFVFTSGSVTFEDVSSSESDSED